MPGLEDLYREIILDHYRAPRNRGELPVPPAHKAEGFNPLCGDEVVLYLDGRASSSIQISVVHLTVHGGWMETSMSTHFSCRIVPLGGVSAACALSRKLGELLQGVVKFPVRIKCATLAWNTLQQGLDEIEEEAS